MILQTVIMLIGLCLSVLAGYFLSSRQTTRITIRDASISAALGTVLLTIVLLQYELVALRDLREQIVQPNALGQLKNIVENSPIDLPMLKAMIARKEKIENEAASVVRGRIELRDEDEVIAEWSRSFSESATSILATNYISPSFWLKGSEFSKKQFEIQTLARHRGVTIKRIFIYMDSNPKELKEIDRLAQQQRSIGIEVRYLSYSKLRSSPLFIKLSPVLNGAIDFVAFDLNVVLLTFPNLDTREIQWGILSKERELVDGARDLFEKLWSVSDEKIS